MRSAARVVVLAFLLAGAGLAAVGSAPVHALNLPPGFYDETVFEHLQDPTAIRFAPDGRIFVAGKQGVIYVFDSLEDEEPTIFADLRKQVYDNGDRGILGLELDPELRGKPSRLRSLHLQPRAWGRPARRLSTLV